MSKTFCDICGRAIERGTTYTCKYDPDKGQYITHCGYCWRVKNDNPPTEERQSTDNVSHPSHYSEGRKYEPIAVIEDWELDFCLGNTVKYISRAGRKSSAAMDLKKKTIEDLKKAKFYLDWKIDKLESNDEVDTGYQE